MIINTDFARRSWTSRIENAQGHAGRSIVPLLKGEPRATGGRAVLRYYQIPATTTRGATTGAHAHAQIDLLLEKDQWRCSIWLTIRMSCATSMTSRRKGKCRAIEEELHRLKKS